MPLTAAPISSSRTACQLRPALAAIKLEIKNKAISATGKETQSCHCSYPTSIKLLSHVGGIPKSTIKPTSPPKTDSNLFATEGKARAITSVVPAKYGPESLAAAAPRINPNSPAAIMATRNAIQIEAPKCVINDALEYPPTAINAP